MNILICDDDKLYVDMIRKYVDEFFVEHKITDYKVYEYYSGDEAAKNSEKIDIAFLDVDASFDINVAYDVFAAFQLRIKLLAECAVEAVGIDLFVFQKVACGNMLAKLFGGDEKIFYAMTFCAAGWTAGAADAEVHGHVFFKQMLNQG